MKTKQIIWLGSSRKDLIKLPEDIKDSFGYGLYTAQKGAMHENAKVLSGFGSAKVIELKDSDAAGTYRTVYTIQMPEVIFVLHMFQKKSKQGIKTSQEDIALIRSRLQQAQEIYKEIIGKGRHEKTSYV
ncbi:MAG: type II toxin-antitoxin system RelE/ParE family toxin [Candidatus Babeliales bacterium]